MRCTKESLLLYAVTDRSWLGEAQLYGQAEARKAEAVPYGQAEAAPYGKAEAGKAEAAPYGKAETGKAEAALYRQVEAALKGGATFIQLREKQLGDEAFLREARDIKALCKKYQVPFVINDSVEIALAADADGVHVGQGDMEAGDVRKKLGKDKIIGVSAQTVEQALLAQAQGADYLGVGAVFPTGTKTDAVEVGRDTVKAICETVDIPVIAIGGISTGNVLELAGSGICGIAVISALFAQPDIEAAARGLKRLAGEMVNA